MGNIFPSKQHRHNSEEQQREHQQQEVPAWRSVLATLSTRLRELFARIGSTSSPLQTTNEFQNYRDDENNLTMGAHSRSSSDADNLPYNIALEIVKLDFMRDFDVTDLTEEFLLTIFTPTQYAYIKAAKDSTESSCIRLFALLATKEIRVIEQFLTEVKRRHEWLQELVQNVRIPSIDKSDKDQRYADIYFWLQTGLSPKFPEYNVRRPELYMKLRQALLQVKRYDRVALVGAFGFGKKWLAIDACSDYRVARAMNFRIFWLDMRECRSAISDLDKLKDLYGQLTRSRPPTPTVGMFMEQPSEYARQISDDIRKITDRLKSELEKEQNRNCLVVLANVETKHAIKSFNLPCKLLIVTRRKNIADEFVRTENNISLNAGLTQIETNLLFEKYLLNGNFEKTCVDSIFDESKGHPLLISIIAQSLRQGDSWNSWIEKLKIETINDTKLKMAVEKSLQSLEDDLRALYCRIFSILPRRAFVPFDLLRALWNPKRNAKTDLNKLYDFGFLELTQVDGALAYALPFIYSKNLSDSGKDDRKQLLERVIHYYDVLAPLEPRNKIKPYDARKHDYFFFANVDYFLANAERMDVLAKLCFDFGFLEQKLRAVGLLRTISDLEKYMRKFNDSNPDYDRKLHAMRKFLSSIEKTLRESKDALLLQCALMEDDLIYELASQQATNFPEHIWFDESGFFHQRHHIYQLRNQPYFVNLVDHKLCLIKTKTELLLINTALDPDMDELVLPQDVNDGFECSCVHVFRDGDFRITLVLYKTGLLKLWLNKRKSTQTKNAISKINISDPIVAIHVEFLAGEKTYRLHAATRAGQIFVYDWESNTQEFVQKNVPALQTKMQNIRLLRAIPPSHYLVATTHNEVRIWNYQDSSNERGKESIADLIDVVERSRDDRLLVCNDRIWRIGNDAQFKRELFWKLSESVHQEQNVIKCAKLLDDKAHLVLGTKNGLFVLDLQAKRIVLATNVSENITCIDATALDDKKYKYIIVCGVRNKPLLNLFALRLKDAALEWAHSVMPESGGENQLPPAVQLVGGALFDTKYESGGVATLLAVDSKNAIYEISDNKYMSLKLEPKAKITAITMYGEAAFAGCKSGEILNLQRHQYETVLQALFNGEAITFLQLLNENTLIVASSHLCAIVMDWRCSERFHSYALDKTDVKRCFQIDAQHVLLVLECCQFMLLNMKHGNIVEKCDSTTTPHFYGGCDLQDKRLFIATESDEVPIMQIYDFGDTFARLSEDAVSLRCSYSSEKDKLMVHKLNKLIGAKITCLAATIDASLVAIGTATGPIWIYKCDGDKTLKVLIELRSHSGPVSDMKFSPSKLVLASCGEQLNFWSVDEMLNNPLTPQNQRKNSRFQDFSSSGESEEVDATLQCESKLAHLRCIAAKSSVPKSMSKATSFDDVFAPSIAKPAVQSVQSATPSAEQVWSGKHGCSAESPLLACVNFAGPKVTKFCANPTFTRFNMVDSEGCYYALSVKNFNQTPATRDNYEPPLSYTHEIE